MSQLDSTRCHYSIDEKTFCGMIGDSKQFLQNVLADKFAVREFSKFIREVELFFNSCGDDLSFALCTVDGQETRNNFIIIQKITNFQYKL